MICCLAGSRGAGLTGLLTEAPASHLVTRELLTTHFPEDPAVNYYIYIIYSYELVESKAIRRPFHDVNVKALTRPKACEDTPSGSPHAKQPRQFHIVYLSQSVPCEGLGS